MQGVGLGERHCVVIAACPIAGAKAGTTTHSVSVGESSGALISKKVVEAGTPPGLALPLPADPRLTGLNELLVRALFVGRSLTRLVDAACLSSQNGDADILAGFDVVRIVQRRVELVNLTQEFPSTSSKLLYANTEQGLPRGHTNDAYSIRRRRSSVSTECI